MPTSTKYTRSIINDFPNHKINTTDLSSQIRNSSITISLERIDTIGDVCDIWFRDPISSSEEAILNAIIAAHEGATSLEEYPVVQISEEVTRTGGYFCTRSINILAESNNSSSENVSWPYPITALAMRLTTTDVISEDQIDMSVGANTIIGVITTNAGTTPSVWTSGNYVVGDKVLYTVPTFGERVYTCITDTTSNQPPSDKLYWRHGYEISVSPTVLVYAQIGFYINLFNGPQNEDLGRVLHKTSTSIFVENAPTISFLASSPTYVRMTVYVLKGHYIGNGRVFSIGDGKIGGSYVPTDTIVNIKYTNNGASAKRLVGFVEYLY